MLRNWCALYIVTWKCASRHNGVHFFNISTSKSGPRPSVLTLLTSKCSSCHNGVHFFSTSQLAKVLRCWCFLHILTSKCASGHNGVQFFISHLARWLRTGRFSGATSHWKHSVSRFSYIFAHLHLLSSDSFSSLIFSDLLWSSLFFSSLLSSPLLSSSLLFSDPSHLCFPICPYCRKFDF